MNVAGTNVAGSWPEAQSKENSTWRELRGTRLVLMITGEKLVGMLNPNILAALDILLGLHTFRTQQIPCFSSRWLNPCNEEVKWKEWMPSHQPNPKNLYRTGWKFHLRRICFSQPCQAPSLSVESQVIVFSPFGSLLQVRQLTPLGHSSNRQGSWSCVGAIGNLGTANVPWPRRGLNVSGQRARAPLSG